MNIRQHLIRTVVGRGYQFRGEVRARHASRSERAEPGAASDVSGPRRARTNLLAPTSDLIGRAAEIREVIGLLADDRFITLTGTGGIGKTRLALEVARQLLPQFADGVWIAELASLSDPQLVPITVAAALGLELVSGVVSPERIAAAVGSRHIMLVLDNCEHVIDAAAGMVEALLHVSPSVRVIATSREPLRTESERLYRVLPLGVPAEDAQALEDVLQHGAVALFVARAREADPPFSPDQQTAVVIAAICRRLDGIPLAIELAAARAPTLGMHELASRLVFALVSGSPGAEGTALQSPPGQPTPSHDRSEQERLFAGGCFAGFGFLSSIKLGLCPGPIHDPVKDAG